jgi:hypothetical protein
VSLGSHNNVYEIFTVENYLENLLNSAIM